MARKLKAEGMRAGVPDLMLPVPHGGYHGLFIEMKTKTGTLSWEQKWWRDELQGRGYRWIRCRDHEEGIDALCIYLGIERAAPALGA